MEIRRTIWGIVDALQFAIPRDPALLSRVTVDDVWERGTSFGSPERVTELMKRYMRRTGTTHWMAQMRCGGVVHSKALRSMELFARYVMPALREEEAKLATV